MTAQTLSNNFMVKANGAEVPTSAFRKNKPPSTSGSGAHQGLLPNVHNRPMPKGLAPHIVPSSGNGRRRNSRTSGKGFGGPVAASLDSA